MLSQEDAGSDWAAGSGLLALVGGEKMVYLACVGASASREAGGSAELRCARVLGWAVLQIKHCRALADGRCTWTSFQLL